MTHDTWHMTCDKCHVTHDRWGEVNFVSKFQWRCSEDISTKDDLLTKSMSNKGVCRTALATPGLLNRMGKFGFKDSKFRRTSKFKDRFKSYVDFNNVFVHDWLGLFWIWNQLTVDNGRVTSAKPVAVGLSDRWKVTCDISHVNEVNQTQFECNTSVWSLSLSHRETCRWLEDFRS